MPQHQYQQHRHQYQQPQRQQGFPRQDSDRGDCESEASDLDDRTSVVLVNEGRVISAGGRGSLSGRAPPMAAAFRSSTASRADSLSAGGFQRSMTQSRSGRPTGRSVGDRRLVAMGSAGSEWRGGRQARERGGGGSGSAGGGVAARWRSIPVEQWGAEEVMQWLAADSLMGDKRSQGKGPPLRVEWREEVWGMTSGRGVLYGADIHYNP